MNYRSRQGGGTILGIIIGLIIGLSIAVVVAVTINKTPIPFVDRGVKADRGGDSQLPDLNRSLYGDREAAKRVAQEFQREPAAVTTPQAEPADGKDAAAKTPKPPESAAAKPAASVEWMYYLQAGAFREQSDAENAKAKLALLGIESGISERSSDNGTLHRVRVGPFAQVDAMNKVRAKLSENGVDVAVVRIPK